MKRVPQPLRQVLTGLGFLVAWSALWAPCLVLPTALALAWAAVVVLVCGHLLLARAARHPLGSEVLRLRPPGPCLGWVLLATPLLFLWADAASQLYSRLPFVSPDPGSIIDTYATSPDRWLGVAAVVAVLAPLGEELAYRGWIQHALERTLGVPVGITATALLFSVMHWQLSWIPLYFVLACAFGWTVVTTGSIWSAVILHAGHNAGVLTLRYLNVSAGRPGDAGVPLGAVGGVATVVLGALLLLYIGTRIRELSRHPPSLRTSAPVPAALPVTAADPSR